ncbi:MAG: UDP-N-acetylmuramoyl-tripeptide--D-alanyl-D-alanine ligase [Acidimicrobiales bacterium]
MRWSLREIAAATSGSLSAVPSAGAGSDRAATRLAGADPHRAPTVTSVGIDSRQLSPGALFVAIRSERDGHHYLGAAVEAVAVAVLVEHGRAPRREIAAPLQGRQLEERPQELAVQAIEVPDTGAALLALGRAARGRLRGPVVGITGSVGKTSTKDLAAAALAAGLLTTASARSFNNELGVPLTLANAPEDAEVAVVEMGSRGPGHIRRLAEVARPDVGVVTAVAAAHTEMFGGLDEVAAAKGELVEALGPAGTAILNAGDTRVAAMASRAQGRVLRYSAGPHDGASLADVAAEGVRMDDQLRPRFVARTPWGRVEVVLEARGAHQVGNALAALSVAAVCGVDLDAAAAALAGAELSPGRMEIRRTSAGATVIDDTYNANPSSAAAALHALAALPGTRRIAVLGEMAELGRRSGQEHLGVAALAAGLGIRVIAVDTPAYGLAPADGIDGAMKALGSLGPGDAVLVKASRVAGLERLVTLLVRPAGQESR